MLKIKGAYSTRLLFVIFCHCHCQLNTKRLHTATHYHATSCPDLPQQSNSATTPQPSYHFYWLLFWWLWWYVWITCRILKILQIVDVDSLIIIIIFVVVRTYIRSNLRRFQLFVLYNLAIVKIISIDFMWHSTDKYWSQASSKVEQK